MAALERDLGVRLLERRTTSLQATPQGTRFYQRALGVLAEYHEAIAEARGQTETPAGLIRVNAPAAFGQFRLNAMLAPFLAQYPKVDIKLIEHTETIQTQGRYRVNNALAIRESLAAGGGIGLCPLWLVQDLLDDVTLTRVLPQWHGQPQPLHLLSPSRRYQPLRARLLLDYLVEQIALLPGYNAS